MRGLLFNPRNIKGDWIMAKTKIADYSKEFDLAIVYSDLHIPYHDEKLTDILLDVIADLEPTLIVDLGDLINADCISDHLKKSKQLTGLQDELKHAHKWLSRVNKAAPYAKKVLLTDNHFWSRIAKKIMKENYWLEDLDAVRPENLLKLEDYDWEWGNDYNWKNTLIMQHGDDNFGSSVNPVNTVLKVANNNSISVIRGHSHNYGSSILKHGDRSLLALQLGTFHNLDKISYIKHKELIGWSQNFVLLYLSKSTKEFFHVPVFFINGRCMVNGKLYG